MKFIFMKVIYDDTVDACKTLMCTDLKYCTFQCGLEEYEDILTKCVLFTSVNV